MTIQTDAPYARDNYLDTAQPETRLTTWTLLPNMRLGTFSHYTSDNNRVFATLDGSCVCRHGEVGGTIRAWITHEKGRPLVRWSTCTCTGTHGLTRKLKPEELPPKPGSYFEMLQAADATRLELESEPDVVALAMPLRCEDGPASLAGDGRFFCSHGNEFVVKKLPVARKHVSPLDSPIKKPRTISRRFHTKTCSCCLVLPNRTTFPELPFVAESLSN